MITILIYVAIGDRWVYAVSLFFLECSFSLSRRAQLVQEVSWRSRDSNLESSLGGAYTPHIEGPLACQEDSEAPEAVLSPLEGTARPFRNTDVRSNLVGL